MKLTRWCPELEIRSQSLSNLPRIISAGAVQTNGLGLLVPVFQISPHVTFELAYSSVTASWHAALCNFSEQTLHQIEPTAAGRSEMHMVARMFQEPTSNLVNLVHLVCGVVIHGIPNCAGEFRGSACCTMSCARFAHSHPPSRHDAFPAGQARRSTRCRRRIRSCQTSVADPEPSRRPQKIRPRA